ncbi:MAG TPA: adenine phosphoribosyltransferase [Gammaproteobacteria bacterium]|nr:adenine phosphoribosyltransferase [Gammaproteobacteria bacterium]
MTLNEVTALIRDVPDFPSPGIVFKDITPLLADPAGFDTVIDQFAQRLSGLDADAIFGIESRGFIFGAALANRMALPLHLVRKKGKLPRETISIAYALEYGVDHLEVHRDALVPGAKCLVVDDVIATGGTAQATAKLIEDNGASVAAFAFVIELSFLSGRDKLNGCRIESLITY